MNLLYKIWLVTFLDMVGVGLVIPCLPSLAKSLGLSAFQYGFVSICYGLCTCVTGFSVLYALFSWM